MNTEPILDDNSPNTKRSTKRTILFFAVFATFILGIFGFLFFSVSESTNDIDRPPIATPEPIIEQPLIDSVLQEGQEAIEALDSFSQ